MEKIKCPDCSFSGFELLAKDRKIVHLHCMHCDKVVEVNYGKD